MASYTGQKVDHELLCLQHEKLPLSAKSALENRPHFLLPASFTPTAPNSYGTSVCVATLSAAVCLV